MDYEEKNKAKYYGLKLNNGMTPLCNFSTLWLFLIRLLFLWPVLLIVAIMVKVKMPGGPAIFTQKRVGKGGKLFTCHKFRTMTVNHNGSTVSVAGDSLITPYGATLRHYKLDELPGLWDVLIGNMRLTFGFPPPCKAWLKQAWLCSCFVRRLVGPRPDVPGYADKLVDENRDVLKLRPGITGPATLKYRLEDEMIADFVRKARSYENDNENLGFALPENVKEMTDQELAVWYNDNVIYPDKVRLNCYYYRHYYRGSKGLSSLIGLKCLMKDIEMIFATVLGRKVKFGGEEF